jgi:hypothetical protein
MDKKEIKELKELKSKISELIPYWNDDKIEWFARKAILIA